MNVLNNEKFQVENLNNEKFVKSSGQQENAGAGLSTRPVRYIRILSIFHFLPLSSVFFHFLFVLKTVFSSS